VFGVYPNLILEPISSSVDLVVKNMGAIKWKILFQNYLYC
jgi:hypothetical protein